VVIVESSSTSEASSTSSVPTAGRRCCSPLRTRCLGITLYILIKRWLTYVFLVERSELLRFESGLRFLTCGLEVERERVPSTPSPTSATNSAPSTTPSPIPLPAMFKSTSLANALLRSSSRMASVVAAPRFAAAAGPSSMSMVLPSKRAYHEKVLDHYNKPRNVRSHP
jgi:hypothetical protein